MEQPIIDLSTPVLPSPFVTFKGNAQTVEIDYNHVVEIWRMLKRDNAMAMHKIFMIKVLRITRHNDTLGLKLAKDIIEWIGKREGLD